MEIDSRLLLYEIINKRCGDLGDCNTTVLESVSHDGSLGGRNTIIRRTTS